MDQRRDPKTVEGALLQGADNEFYFISVEDLEQFRLSRDLTEKAREILGASGVDVAFPGRKKPVRVPVDGMRLTAAIFGPIGVRTGVEADDPTASYVTDVAEG